MISIIHANGSEKDFFDEISKRNDSVNADVEKIVKSIIEDVKTSGDTAVKAFTAKFDSPEALYYEVPQDAISDALDLADRDFVDSLLNCIEKITDFHTRQKLNGFVVTNEDGSILGQRIRGLEKVGIYVPGGTAAYPSTVLMNAIPAKIAGVKEIIMTTPPQKDGKPNNDILVAAALCGVDRIFMCGGAQAIAALAYGTEMIPRVSKIVGPGNIYVATAKKLLYGTVDIDMFAGPSEILVIADKDANPVYVAADLLSQAEHDVMASAILVTTSEELANTVATEIDRQTKTLSRKNIINASIENYGKIIITDTMEKACEIANTIAPEHLEVLANNPMEYIGKLDNCGSLFLGEYAPEPLGDYYAGPNHVLPTSGTARFFSPLSVDSFVKKSAYIYYTKEALEKGAEDIMLVANREQLTAHANAIKVRMNNV